MQTILGSGGAIGIELAKALTAYTSNIRLVSRHPQKVNPTDEVVAADVLKPEQLRRAVEGSDIVYVTAGFPYSYDVWKESWPLFIQNLLELCRERQCKLVFFDNVYMYDPQHLNGMTEQTPVNPSSKKGALRADIVRMIQGEMEKGSLQALIARSADYYGPTIKGTSILTETVFKPLSQGKKANWLGSDRFRHSFTFTPDAGKATALLGNTPEAYGQVWHLPTASDPMNGRQWVETVARHLEVQPSYRTVPKFMVKILGLFDQTMRETTEMMYQYDRDYVFDSSKIEQAFDLTPTPYEEGIQQIIRIDYKVPV